MRLYILTAETGLRGSVRGKVLGAFLTRKTAMDHRPGDWEWVCPIPPIVARLATAGDPPGDRPSPSTGVLRYTIERVELAEEGLSDLQRFALAVLAGDPAAADAVRDVLARGG